MNPQTLALLATGYVAVGVALSVYLWQTAIKKVPEAEKRRGLLLYMVVVLGALWPGAFALGAIVSFPAGERWVLDFLFGRDNH